MPLHKTVGTVVTVVTVVTKNIFFTKKLCSPENFFSSQKNLFTQKITRPLHTQNHCENLKTLPPEHHICCQMCQMCQIAVSKSTKKVKKQRLHNFLLRGCVIFLTTLSTVTAVQCDVLRAAVCDSCDVSSVCIFACILSLSGLLQAYRQW